MVDRRFLLTADGTGVDWRKADKLLEVVQGVLHIQREIEAQHRHRLLETCQCRICQLAREAADLLVEAYASARKGAS